MCIDATYDLHSTLCSSAHVVCVHLLDTGREHTMVLVVVRSTMAVLVMLQDYLQQQK